MGRIAGRIVRSSVLLCAFFVNLLVNVCIAQADDNAWTSVGPDGGRIETSAFSPEFANDRTVFAGTPSGVYKSTDGGTTWSAVNIGIDDRRILSLAVSPDYATDRTVFAGVAGSGGVYKSTDAGLNWSKVYYSAAPNSNLDDIECLAVSANFASDRTIFAGKSSYGGSKLLKSTDGGENWSNAGTGISGSYVRSLAISTAFAADRTIYAATSGGVFKSTDGGANWLAVNSGLYHTNVLSLAISTGFATDRTIFAITTIDPFYGGGIFKSTDGGANWSWVDGNYSISDKTVSGCTCLTLSPDYAVDQTVFAGTKDAGILISRDGGYGFSQVDGMVDKNILTLTVSPGYSADKTAFAGTYANMLKSTDRGGSWNPANNGIKNLEFGPFSVSPNYAVDQTVITQANNVFKKTNDGGTNWSEAPFGKGAYSLAYSPGFASDRTLFAGVMAGGVYKSADGGSSWVPAKSGIDQVSINSLAISPAFVNDKTIFAGSLSNGVFKTVSGGDSWNAVNSGISGSGLYIKALTLSPGYAADQTVFAGTNAGVYKSSNGGSSWSAFNTGLLNTRITALAISPGYAADSTIFAGTEAGVFKSTDGGASWSAFSSGIGSVAISALAMSPGYGVDRIIYAGTSGSGVFKSADGGQNWTSVNSGLVNLDISYLSYTNDRSVFAITSGGLFKLHDQTLLPMISVNPLHPAFGNVLITAPPAVISANISNTGSGDLIIIASSLTGIDSTMFSISPGSCTSITPTLPPGTSCTVNIAFAPTAIGLRSATLQITSNDGLNQIMSLPLSGTGVPLGPAPSVTSFLPANGGVAPVTTTVQATFSIQLDPASFTAGSFSVTRGWETRAIAARGNHTLALKADGTAVAWGDSGVPAGLAGITSIATGSAHSVVLKNNGTVVAWGSNSYGQTTVPAGLAGVTAIAAGGWHTVALKSNSTIVGWGSNSYGQGSSVAGLTGVIAIAAGQVHTVALKNDGSVIAWGDGFYGQTAVPAGLTGVSAIAAGQSHTVALKSDGTVVAWGGGGNANYGQATVPAGLTGVIAIAAGDYHTIALKSDGTVVAWGANWYGQATIPAGLTGVIAIAAGLNHTVALKSDGTVIAWGYNNAGQTTIPAGLNVSGNVVSGTVTYDPASRTATLTPAAPLVDGVTYYATVAKVTSQTGAPLAASVTWSFGTIPIPPTVTAYQPVNGALASINTAIQATFSVPLNPATVTASNFTISPPGAAIAIAAGALHIIVLKNDGTVVSWGENYYGQTTRQTTLTGVTAIAAGDYHSVALKSDGTVVCWGKNDDGQCAVPTGLSGVIAIAAGGSQTMALKNNGTVVAWGANNFGQSTVPAGLIGVAAIAVSGSHSVVLKSDGTVISWGFNGYGQTTVPTGLSEVTAIAAGSGCTVALKKDGTVVTWGNYAQATVLPGFTDVKAIAVNGTVFGVKNDGTLLSSNGQNTGPADLTGVMAIASGAYCTVALKDNKTVVAWGYPSCGEYAVPADLSSIGDAVNGTLTYDADSRTATLTPSVPLIDGVTYYARVADVTSQTGVPLAAPVKWSFKAAGPTLNVTPLALAFGNVITNTVSTTRAITINNPGATVLTVSGITVGLDQNGNTAPFTVTPGTCNTLTPTIAAGGSCTVNVSFYPSTSGARSAALNIASNASTNPTMNISLSGNGIDPQLLSLTLTGDASGSVRPTPSPGGNCFSGSCTYPYLPGTVVTLTATPAPGSTFTGWGGDCSGSGQCTLTMNAGKTVTAGFKLSGDAMLPAVTGFTMPATATALTVPVTTFSASDNIGVTGYLITENHITPSAYASGWSGTPPANVTFTAPGNCYAYAWARDAAGNVSAAAVAMVNITVTADTDAVAPLITAFILPSGTTLTAPITTFAVTDNVGVNGYLVSETGATPPASDPRWLGAPPASFTFTTYGSKTLYAWAKDAAGNVSARVAATCQLMDPEQQLDTVLTDWPANPAETSPSTFAFTASKAGATFECSLDGQGYFACPSPVSFGALANGSHTFSVRAKDGGVYDATPASSTWTVYLPIVRLNLNTFTSIASAYAASSDGHNLEIKGLEFSENLVFDRPIAITLKGGFDAGYLTAAGNSGIHGNLTIVNGTVTVDNITIM